MSIPFQARLVDLSNLFLAKGANFLLTAIIFALLSSRMDANSFGEFGYWWSIAVMVGGVFLGGIVAATVRAAMVDGSLRNLTALLFGVGWSLLLLVVLVSLFAFAKGGGVPWLLISAAIFGIAIQVQTALFSLLRVIEASWENALSTIAVVLSIPAMLLMMLSEESGLPQVFFALSGAFFLGTAIAFIVSFRKIQGLFSSSAKALSDKKVFLANSSAFIAVNLYVYLIINIDFTIFRLFGMPQDFSEMASAKIFFERFALPLLLVFSGAISMRVMRHPIVGTQEGGARLVVHLKPGAILAFVAVVGALVGGYWLFTHVIGAEVAPIPLSSVTFASTGYLLYTLSGILFDVLVVRRSFVRVAVHIAFFLLIHVSLQLVLIKTFGVSGWAIGWMLFNLFVLIFLARDGVEIVKGQSGPAG